MRNLVPPHLLAAVARDEREGSADGAALVVDAEGSTALAARLEPYGTAGAEALADVLGAVFAPMVHHVVAFGGFVAEFAGDGIVAVFIGDRSEAAHRALAAARAITSGLDHLADLSTPDGPARLIVRSIVGAGSVDWRIWRTDQDDLDQNAAYTYVGSAVTEAQRGEAVTPGGVISLGPAARAALPSDVAGDPLAGGFVAATARGAEAEPPQRRGPQPGLAVADAWFYPAEVEAWTGRGEFRDVVTVFAEFRHIPDTSSDSMMSVLLDLVGAHRGFLCNVVRADPDSDGVRVLAFWGAPTSREHDIGYALRFLEELRLRTDPTWIRAAATRSAVFAGFVGTESQESYTGIGYGVNLAARMCARTSWGEIRIDEQIAARLEPPWAYDDLGPMQYRGFGGPIRTHVVTHVPPVRSADPLDGAFIGRRAELDQLEDLTATLWSGRPAGTVAVVGDAGVGKSALIDALRQRLQDRDPAPIWLEARADEIRSQPFSTLRDGLAGYFGRPGRQRTDDRLAEYVQDLGEQAPGMAEELARSRRTLGELLEVTADVRSAGQLDPRTRFENVVLAVENVILALSQQAPVILTISDAQWIDEGTATIFERVGRDLGDARLAIITETRTADAGLSHDHRVAVGPLDDDEITELAGRFVGRAPSAALVEWLSLRSGGNPYFVRQLLSYLREAHPGAEADDSRIPVEGVPIDLRRALVSRLDGLPGSVRRIVQTASVLGADVDLAVLCEVVGEHAYRDDDVAFATRFGAWEPSDTGHVEFRNRLVREAAYGMLLEADRRALHRDAARAIAHIRGDDDRTAAELAYHLDKAGEPDEAARHYLVAGRVAAHGFANQDALDHLARALTMLDAEATAERYEALRIVHDVHDVLGDRQAQQAAIEAMAPVAPSADIALLEARLHAALGEYGRADEVLGNLDPSDVDGSSLFLRAQIARYRGAADDARTHAVESRRRYETAGDGIRVAAVDDFLGGIAYEQGEFERSAELHRAAADVFARDGRALDEIRALNNLGTAIFALGDYAAARSIHEAGAARSRAIGYRMGEGDHLDNVGGTAWAVGAYDLAIERYEQALAIRERMDDAWGVAISKGNLAGTLRALGRCDDAVALYREALDIDRRIGRRRGEAYDLHGIGLCHLDMGRYNLASEALGSAAAIRTDLGEGHLARESNVACAVAMARRGDHSDAAALVEAALSEEGSELFSGAVETTATILRCAEVLETAGSDRAGELRDIASRSVRERASRISDDRQRASYLEAVASHSQAVTGGPTT